MRKQDQLLHLIKSLSATEKKYFSQHTAMRGDSKSYLALYEELQSSDTYDADALSKRLKKTKQNLAHEKDHLQNVLLKILRNYEGDRYIETSLHDALDNVRLLNHKGQHDMALGLCRTAQKEAEYYEKWDILWALLKAESGILNASNIPRPERIELQVKNQQRMEYATAHMDMLNRFEKLYVEMDVIFQKRVVVRQESDTKDIRDILSDPLMTADHTQILLQRYQTTMLCSIHIYLPDYEKALGYYKKLLDLSDKYPMHIGLTLREYFVILNHYMAMLSLTGRYDEAYRFIDSLKRKSLDHIHYNKHTAEILIKQYTLLQELLLGKKPEHKKRGLEAVERLKSEYDIFMAIPSLAERSAGLGNAAKICFYADQPGECIYWLEKIFSDTEPSSLKEVHNFCKVLFVMCHAELKNYSILPYLVKSAERFLKKNNAYMAVEKLTLDHLKKLPGYKTDKERKAAYQSLADEYNKLKADKSAPNSFRHLNYALWAERNG